MTRGQLVAARSAYTPRRRTAIRFSVRAHCIHRPIGSPRPRRHVATALINGFRHCCLRPTKGRSPRIPRAGTGPRSSRGPPARACCLRAAADPLGTACAPPLFRPAARCCSPTTADGYFSRAFRAAGRLACKRKRFTTADPRARLRRARDAAAVTNVIRSAHSEYQIRLCIIR